MLEIDRSDSWRRAFRVELRAQAIGLAWRRWSVLPGTYPAGSQWMGHEGSEHAGLVPVHDDWQDRIGAAAEEVASWWNGRPYNLLLATGVEFDAIEVSAELGSGAARVLRTSGLPAPIIATPTGRWIFLTHAGSDLNGSLADRPDVVLHGAGSWVPLPPTAFQHGVVHWRVRPEVSGWQLPQPHTIQDALVDAIHHRARSAQLVAAD